MALDQLMDGYDVDQFYRTWVDTMRTAQNSPEEPGREKDAAEFVESLLPDDPAIDVRKVSLVEDGSRPNLIVTYNPPDLVDPRKAIMFAAVHTDCVPAQDDSQLTYQFKDGIGNGRGVADNGSNVVASLYMLRHWAATKPRFGRPMAVTFTVDEEASATDVGFPELVKQGFLDPTRYEAAVFADTPWAGWNTQGTGLFDIKVNVDEPGHSGVTIGASTVAMDLYGVLNKIMQEKFPLQEPYNRSSIIQPNITDGGKNTGHTATSGYFRIAGDIRTHPAYPHDEVIKALETATSEYLTELGKHPQFGSHAEKVHVEFEFEAGEDGHVMSPEFLPVARRVVLASFAVAGIQDTEPIQSVCGGLPGLRNFSEQGILTLATGASGRPDVINGYHAPNEHIHVEDVAMGPTYLDAIAKNLDKELTQMGR